MDVLVVGANYRSASGLVRDRIASEEVEVPGILARLRAAGINQAVWLSTCDRVEVQAVHAQPEQAALVIAGLMAERAGLARIELEGQLYTLTGDAALRHIFAVACALDSQVVGEPQVLGQVKAAHRQAAAAGATGPELEAVFQAAYGVAKRVRTETPIAERPVSIAAAAVQTARDIHGDLSRCSALLVGLGDMGGLLVEQLRAAGLAHLTVVARSERRAQATAHRLGGHYAPLAELEAALPGADIVVAAAGLGRYMLSAAQVATALPRRRRRPVFLIDAAIPADIDSQVGDLEGAFVYDLQDLERLALEGRATREAAAAAAWTLVDQAVAGFRRARAERAAVPALAALRRHFEATRARLLAEHRGLDAEAATRLLINRLLHPPSEVLRAMAAEDGNGDGPAERLAAERLLRRLFRLDAAPTTEESAGDDEPLDAQGMREGGVR